MVIRYRALKGYKYQLLETYTVRTGLRPPCPCRLTFAELDTDGTLTIHDGYAWDGPSGPAVDTKDFMRGSLVHDALYQLIRQGMLPTDARGHADRLLRRLCQEDGMTAARAWWVYTSLRAFGSLATRRRPEGMDEVHEAP